MFVERWTCKRTIPELLLILEVIRYLKRHAEVAGQAANAWSELTRGNLVATWSGGGVVAVVERVETSSATKPKSRRGWRALSPLRMFMRACDY